MKKIPSLFLSTDDHILTREVNPLCQWVIDGEGVPTAKLDGSACAVINGKLYKRYDNSKLVSKTERVRKHPPQNDWIHCGDMTDRGQHIYWIPVTMKDYYHQMAWAWGQGRFDDGTYELVGPEVQGNPHNTGHNALIRHATNSIFDYIHNYCNICHNPRTYDEIERILARMEYEGIVWHHPDGRMAKITKKKFGLPWP